MVVQTELGKLHVKQGEIMVMPRGIKYSIYVPTGVEYVRVYCVEAYNGNHFELPELGPIGANGLANPRHFEYPVASFEDHGITK